MKISSRIFGLDLLRALAIIQVVLVHGAYILEGTVLENFPFFPMIDGVDVFFALSGYLIGKILMREINDANGFKDADLLVFWKRRWLRTLPNYYLILLINYFIVKHNIIHEYIQNFNWKFFFFLQNFSKPFMGFFWESWSLTVEEWFYILTPVLLLVLLRFTKPKVAFLIATLVMMTAPLLHRAFTYDPTIDGTALDLVFRKLVVNRLDSIAYGLLAAWLFFYFPKFWYRIRYLSLLFGIVLMYLLMCYDSDSKTFYSQVWSFSLYAISATLLLPWAESFKHATGIFAKVVTHISIISYSMYLINGALISEVIHANFAPVTPGDRYFKYGVYWVSVIFFASLLYRFYEKPMMDFRDKIGKRKTIK